jgi:hypothetical protein
MPTKRSVFDSKVFDGKRYWKSGSSPYGTKREATKHARLYRSKGWPTRTIKESDGWTNWVIH